MKHLLKCVLVVLLGTPLIAEGRIGIEAGVLVNKLNLKESASATVASTMANKIGYRAGLLADIGIGERIAVQPGIFYCARGGKQKADIPFFGSAESDVAINYLEVPILVLFKMQIGPGRIFAGAGPSVSIALSGKEKLSLAGVEESAKIEFGSDTSKAKRLDYAANFNAGYELDMGVFLRIGYYLGLANLKNNPPGIDDKLKNRAFQITLGYFIGGRRD